MVYNKRNIAAYLVSCYFILTGRLRKMKKRAARGEFIVSVYFHHPSREQFAFCVKWFKRNGFHFLTLPELEAIAKGEKPIPPSSVVLTADDGWRSNLEGIVAVANEYKVPVTIFASTKPVETGEPYWWSVIAEAHQQGLVKETVSGLKGVPNNIRESVVEKAKTMVSLPREAMTVEELVATDKTGYVQIGSHTVTHPILTQCPDERAAFEIAESGRTLSRWLSKDIPYFAYPNGAFTEREVSLLRQHGYRMAFSTEQSYVTPGKLKNIYAIPRFDVLETVSFTENLCRMTGVWFNR